MDLKTDIMWASVMYPYVAKKIKLKYHIFIIKGFWTIVIVNIITIISNL